MILPPHKYQTKAANFILQKGTCYLMLDCGLGKTRATLMAIEMLIKKHPTMQVLIFCPLYVALETWQQEIKKWDFSLTSVVLHGPSRNHRCSLANTKNIIVIPYSGLKWFYNKCQKREFLIKKYMVVFDESTYCKSPVSKRTKMLMEMAPMFSDFRVNLSATPTPNGLVDLWSQYFLLDGGKRLTAEFSYFRNRYFDYTGPPKFKTTIRKGAEEHIYNAIEDITLRMSAEDYLELPPLITNDVVLELPKKLRKQYDYLEEEFCLEFPEVDILAASAAALSSKLRQFLQGGLYDADRKVQLIHNLKAQMLKQIVEQNNGRPVLCFIQFKFEYEILCSIMRTKLPLMAGGVSATQVQAHMRMWNRRKIPLLLAHPGSIAHGVNLQNGGSTIVWMALPWSLEQYHQAPGRLHRQGQKASKVIQHRLIIHGTKDIDVAHVLSRKDAVQADLFRALSVRRRTLN